MPDLLALNAPKARIGLLLPGGTINATGLLSALTWHCVVPINPTETGAGMTQKLQAARVSCLVALEGIETAPPAAAAGQPPAAAGEPPARHRWPHGSNFVGSWELGIP